MLSCFNVCPTGAITMKDVDFAGYQPFIDERICNGAVSAEESVRFFQMELSSVNECLCCMES